MLTNDILYIYIYIEREREREICVCVRACVHARARGRMGVGGCRGGGSYVIFVLLNCAHCVCLLSYYEL